MYFEQRTAEQISLRISRDKAERLLSGLQQHAEELGDEGEALRNALAEAGIEARRDAGPGRLEWP